MRRRARLRRWLASAAVFFGVRHAVTRSLSVNLGFLAHVRKGAAACDAAR